MTIPHAQLEALARQICEGRRGEGAYDRKGCKRAHWRERAMALHASCEATPAKRFLFRACGRKV